MDGQMRYHPTIGGLILTPWNFVTALTRGVWLHPLSANDLQFKHIDIFADDNNSKIGLF